jgi:hypothetical protein
MTANSVDERVSAAHRTKLADVYVRQSSVNQVRQHQEGGVSPNRRKFRRPPTFQISVVGVTVGLVGKGHQAGDWRRRLSVSQLKYGKFSRPRGRSGVGLGPTEFSAVRAYIPKIAAAAP